MLKGSVFLVLAAAMLLFLSGCGGKGESKSTPKEIAKQETTQGEHAKEEVRLSPEAIANAGIKTVPVKAEAVQETISVTANISHNQDRLFHVTPRIRGRVVEVSVSVGSEV